MKDMGNNKPTVEPGKYVELGYDLYEVSPEGGEKLVHQTDVNDPEKIVFGVTQGLIEPFARAIEGLGQGDAFEVKVASADAFGDYNPEHVVELERDIFVVDGKFDDEMIKPGNAVPMMTAEGYRVMGLVRDVTADKVVMDFNHPLAGKDICFKGKILTVREATPDELKPAGGCGCGGGCSCDDSCGCDGGGSCGCGCN